MNNEKSIKIGIGSANQLCLFAFRLASCPSASHSKPPREIRCIRNSGLSLRTTSQEKYKLTPCPRIDQNIYHQVGLQSYPTGKNIFQVYWSAHQSSDKSGTRGLFKKTGKWTKKRITNGLNLTTSLTAWE